MKLKKHEGDVKITKKKFEMPDTLVILFVLIILATAATWFLPAGDFDYTQDKDTGREIAVAGSYHEVDAAPVGIMGMLSSIQTGTIESAYIVALLLLVGGSFGIMNGGGAITAGIQAGVTKLGTGNKGLLIIPLTMILLSCMASFLGSMESLLAFIPITVMACRGLGYGTMTGLGLVIVAIAVGSSGTAMSPYTIVIAQGVAGLPIYSGMGYRMVIHGVFLLIATVMMIIYAVRIKKNPEKSITYDLDTKEMNTGDQELIEFDTPRKIALAIFGAGIVFMIVGVIEFGYGTTQIAGAYLGAGILGGIAMKMSPNKIAEHFMTGARGMLYPALLVGVSRGVAVIMTDGEIIATIVNGVSSVLGDVTAPIAAFLMFVVQNILNFIIPSCSGQAAITMPIMCPLGDLLGLTRQTTVLAFILGDSLSSVFFPTCGWLLGGISMAGTNWISWVKWFWKMFVVLIIAAIVFLEIAVMIDLGPF